MDSSKVSVSKKRALDLSPIRFLYANSVGEYDAKTGKLINQGLPRKGRAYRVRDASQHWTNQEEK
jgi:hypothetical protein